MLTGRCGAGGGPPAGSRASRDWFTRVISVSAASSFGFISTRDQQHKRKAPGRSTRGFLGPSGRASFRARCGCSSGGAQPCCPTLNATRAPPSLRLSAHARPPCASAMRRTSESPRPRDEPALFSPRTNFSKTSERSWPEKPGPRSSTENTVSVDSRVTLTRVTSPACRLAFSSRFARARWSSVGSPATSSPRPSKTALETSTPARSSARKTRSRTAWLRTVSSPKSTRALASSSPTDEPSEVSHLEVEVVPDLVRGASGQLRQHAQRAKGVRSSRAHGGQELALVLHLFSIRPAMSLTASATSPNSSGLVRRRTATPSRRDRPDRCGMRDVAPAHPTAEPADEPPRPEAVQSTEYGETQAPSPNANPARRRSKAPLRRCPARLRRARPSPPAGGGGSANRRAGPSAP